MTIGKSIREFLGGTTVQLMDGMIGFSEDHGDVGEDDADWDAFLLDSLDYAERIGFEWDFSAFLFFFRGLDREVRDHGINEDCRTWPFLVAIEHCWPAMTGDAVAPSSHPKTYINWARRKGYL